MRYKKDGKKDIRNGGGEKNKKHIGMSVIYMQENTREPNTICIVYLKIICFVCISSNGINTKILSKIIILRGGHGN